MLKLEVIKVVNSKYLKCPLRFKLQLIKVKIK